ncbi:hypothetical protein HPB52_004462 [Rhipicephalus sanguineus]|uniref:Uncharacterized protein n=1 Tax=Rhipicephalus sanguineus TaxID=34632 RepID=A0A9D4PEN7_RHISA|nr:hypothetical protein HPB52_004462 [Rhipicephalus sanguineus]
MNHIWLVRLRSKADKDASLKTSRLQVKGGFCAVSNSIQQDVTLKIHWVDFAASYESIRHVLSEFGEVLRASNDNCTVAGFEHETSTTRVVRMKLKEAVVLDDLPHLFKFGAGTVLLVAPDRAPLCLRPRAAGYAEHSDMSHDCTTSYARVTKTARSTDDAKENLMEAEKSAPDSNATGRDAKVQATDEKTADVTTQDRHRTGRREQRSLPKQAA